VTTILFVVEPLVGIRARVGVAVGIQDTKAICGVNGDSRCTGLIFTEFEFSGAVVAIFGSGPIVIAYGSISDEV